MGVECAIVFFFKQKTAYDMRISDWSSDVCSSDLPTQEGLFQHYRAIHDAVEIPIIIYNIPGRCIVDMSVETMARLAELPNIIGVKDATADLTRPARTRAAVGSEFAQLTGEDARSEEHTSEFQSLMRISYAVFCLKNKNK